MTVKYTTLLPFGNKLPPRLSRCTCGYLATRIKTGDWFIVCCQEDGDSGLVAQLQECESCREEEVVVKVWSSQKAAEAAVRCYLEELTIEQIRAAKEERVPLLPFALEYRLPLSLLQFMLSRLSETSNLEQKGGNEG